MTSQRLYYNGGTTDTPDWVEITHMTRNDDVDQATPLPPPSRAREGREERAGRASAAVHVTVEPLAPCPHPPRTVYFLLGLAIGLTIGACAFMIWMRAAMAALAEL